MLGPFEQFLDSSFWANLPEIMARRAMLSNTKTRLRIYRKLASLARSGVPLPRALESLWNLASDHGKKPNASLARALEAWRRSINNGETLGDAINGWVPAKERMLIDAAGAARLDAALENAANVVEASRAMSGAIIAGVSYPMFLFVGLGVIMYVFGAKVIPSFAMVKPMETWTGTAAQMAFMSKLTTDWGLELIGGFIGLIALSVWSLPRWCGNLRVRFDQASPPWTFYRLWVGAGVLLSLAALIKAGVPVPEAIRRLRKSATPWLLERLDATLYHVNEGQQLGEALFLTEYKFPDIEIIEDLRLYATLGSFDERMEQLAQEWITEGVNKVRAQAQMLNLGMMVLIGVLVSWMGIGLLALQNQVTSGF